MHELYHTRSYSIQSITKEQAHCVIEMVPAIMQSLTVRPYLSQCSLDILPSVDLSLRHRVNDGVEGRAIALPFRVTQVSEDLRDARING